MSLRYSFPIADIPKFCGCGSRNDVTHALSCKKGGYVIMRHNALRDSLANIMKDVCSDVKIEPQLLPVNPNDYKSCTNTSEQARLDISAVGVRGSFQRTFFDVRVTHPHAPSNVTLKLPELYRKHEKEKTDAYEERVIESEKGSFAPMVFLTTGGIGPQCNSILKTLADRIASKREEIYSHVITHVRTKLRFALLKSVLIAIRGVRGSVAKERTLGTVSLNLTPKLNSYDV